MCDCTSGNLGIPGSTLGVARNDGATLGLNAAEPQSAVIGPPFDFRWASALPRNVADRGKSGNHELLSSIAGFDPQRTWWRHRLNDNGDIVAPPRSF